MNENPRKRDFIVVDNCKQVKRSTVSLNFEYTRPKSNNLKKLNFLGLYPIRIYRHFKAVESSVSRKVPYRYRTLLKVKYNLGLFLIATLHN